VVDAASRVLRSRGKDILDHTVKESVKAQIDPLKKKDKKKDKSKDEDEPWTAPHDEWEARWQPVFKLVNEQRWTIAGGMIGFGIAAIALIAILQQMFDPSTQLPRVLRIFDLDTVSTQILLLIMIAAGALSFLALTRTYRALRMAGEQSLSPRIFWAVVGALVALEVMFSFSRDSIGSLVFWIIIAYGGLTGGLWRVVRWLRREINTALKDEAPSKGKQ
jgi:hypothetical protein